MGATKLAAKKIARNTPKLQEGGGAAPARWRRQWGGWRGALALGILVTLLYLPSVRNGFVYDDEVLIVKESRPDSVEAFTSIFAQRHFPTVPYYRPVSRLTFRLQHALHGKQAAPFHVFNAVLAGLTAMAAWSLLRRPAFRIAPRPAWLASLLILVHPVASSCVYPACSGRETLLPAFLMLLAMDAWLRAGWRPRSAAVLLWTVALFAKEQAIVLPGMFLLADALNLREEPRTGRLARLAPAYVAMGAVVVCYAVIRHAIFGGSEWVVNVFARPWEPLLSYLYAFQTMFLPFVPLVYEPPAAVWAAARWRPALALLLAAALGVVLWRRRRALGRGAWFWLAWFVVIQLPTANLLEQEALFDERYVMLAGLALPAWVASLLSVQPMTPGLRRAALSTAWALIAVFAAITLGRSAAFKDDLAFSCAWARHNPSAAIAWNNIGAHWVNHDRDDLAEPALARARELRPDLVLAHFNTGLLRFKQGRMSESIEAYRQALLLDPDHPLEYNLALALQKSGDADGAAACYRTAIRKSPDNPDAYYNLGLMLAQSGEPAEGVQLFKEASRLRPADPEPVYNIGVALEGQGRLDEALAAYRQARELDPQRADVRQNLGNILLRRRRFAEALAEYDAVLELEPDNAPVRLLRDAARRAASVPDQQETSPLPR